MAVPLAHVRLAFPFTCLLFVVLLAASSLGCSRDSPRGAGGERPLEMLVPTDAETLDPRHATDAVALRATRLIHAGLVRLDPDSLEPRPYLARSWVWTDPLTLRVELRDGVRFHSGAPFTSRDVKATIAAFQSPAVGSRHARVIETIGQVDVEGDHVVIVHLTRAHATLLTDLELPILRADEAFSPPRPEGSLDGLGPYVVAHRTPGEIELTPARDGAMPMPSRSVTLRTVHDENARALRMHAGRADLVVNAFSPTLLPALSQAHGISLNARPGANLTYLMARTDQGLLADVRVRRVLATAIDRERIAQTLLAGRAQAATTLLPPQHWAYTPAPAWPVDRAGAAAALAEAHPGRLHVTLLTSTDRLRGTIARFLAQEFAEIGVDVDVVPLELGTLIGRLTAGDFELATLQLPEITEPNVLRVFLHSSSIPPAGANRGRVRDAEVDRLLDEGESTLDVATRRTIYAALEKRIRDQALFIPLWHEDQIAVVSDRARAFMPSAEGRWLGIAELK